jgi:hypothetical protein
MRIAQRVVLAFIVGGALSITGQLLATLFAALLGPESQFVGPLTLVGLGIVGGILYLAGVYPKLEKWGEFGAFLPFSGFCVAIATATESTKTESGSTASGVTAGIKLVLYVVGNGFIICVIIAVITAALGASGLVV